MRLSRPASVLLLGGSLVALPALVPGGLVPGSGAVSSAGADDIDAPACVAVHGEARYRAYGYDHVVVVRNDCAEPVSCEITTDVDPQPVHAVTVAPESAVDVLTRRGSPAQDFVAQAICKRQGS